MKHKESFHILPRLATAAIKIGLWIFQSLKNIAKKKLFEYVSYGGLQYECSINPNVSCFSLGEVSILGR